MIVMKHPWQLLGLAIIIPEKEIVGLGSPLKVSKANHFEVTLCALEAVDVLVNPK